MSISTIKRLLFFWISSFILAALMYYLLWFIIPHNHVFGALYSMPLYHWDFPLLYILIPCFFYGIVTIFLTKKFQNENLLGRILITTLIIAITILLSSPFGGMLWQYHDMKAGYFPTNWFSKIINKGFYQGIVIGWVIIGLSVPYNIFGSIICYFLTKKGIELFNEKYHIQ